jgi:hypothetical protein
MSVSEAISILEKLGTEEPTRNVEPAEVCAALGVLHDEFAGRGQAAVLSMIGTCCEELLKPRPVDDWPASYECEAWSTQLRDSLEDLPLPKSSPRWELNGILASVFLNQFAEFGEALL